MIEMTLAEVAEAVNGSLHGADPASRVTGPVEFDSRKVSPGGLFVAFPGATVDGHDFAAAAVAAGAVAVIGTRPVSPAGSESVPLVSPADSEAVPMVLVSDPLAAMAQLARGVLDRRPDLTVIGVTGSSGKTTTKDFLAQLTGRIGATVAAAGSFNNELGHPYTVLGIRPDTRFLVLEKGARGIGHISYLCQVAPPRIGVVLNVGVAHIGEFGGVDAIAQAKGELVEALPADGVAVLNADDPAVAAMAQRTRARVVLVGTGPAAEVRARDVRLDSAGRPAYTLVTPEGSAPVRLPVSGGHQVGNTLAVAAVGRALGMELAEVAASLSALRLASPRRMDVFDRPDGITVIDDSYNANPDSTAAALDTLQGLGRDRRTIAVLGYMAELGEHERDGHEQVGRLAAQLGVDVLIVVGEAAAPIAHGAAGWPQWGGESVLVADQDAAVAALRDLLARGDVVLVKGSRYRTWDVADWLRERSVIHA